jgi:hypothetical protein
MKFTSQILNNNACRSPNWQKIFQHCNGRYVRHTEQPQRSFTDRFVDFDQGRALFRTFASQFEASYAVAKPTLQLKLIDPCCSDELSYKLKEGDLLNFYKCLLKA